MPSFTVDIYADTVCPWCYIGKKALDSAIESHLARFPNDTFSLVWRPYMLYPNAKISAYNKKDTLALKFGPTKVAATLDHMQRAGLPYNLAFNWDGLTGSSRDSHTLILRAYEVLEPVRREAFIYALLDGALCRGHDVSDRQGFLVPLGVIHGLGGTVEEVEGYLDSQGARERVEREMGRARAEVGVTAVPSYVVNGRWKVGGCQEPGVWTGLFERVRGEV